MTEQQWRGCELRKLRCSLACTLPRSALEPRLVSGAFPVANDEHHDIFKGTQAPIVQLWKQHWTRTLRPLPATLSPDPGSIGDTANYDS